LYWQKAGGRAAEAFTQVGGFRHEPDHALGLYVLGRQSKTGTLIWPEIFQNNQQPRETYSVEVSNGCWE
jgi:hypothetical protein